MTLVRYNPLNNFVSGTFGDMIENFIREGAKGQETYTPAVDIFKNENSIELHLYTPGISKEDIKIDLSEDLLNISGERSLGEELRKSATQIESKYGSFKRSFKLSKEINIEKIDASYDNGILKITLPINPKKEARVIKVN
ncbi:Hsp20/alpha crystallin family protein [Fulvivirga sediminis]|uniref:Hsp20/alpha crystallin family protein n=1 Tax=Fulvivirga sediminis TaxID=2803949 RepID=A0A937F6P3_9BACT|nr:Hsp20/alpha crystallin family protein [Fulvivirga sediminis]MBL3655078.1 Hsp20/alpha crystallin family protein [Fulvivirga sediminis]